MNHPLPQAFASRMRAQLGAEADAYFTALEQPYQRGIRMNPRKRVDPALVEGGLDSVPWNTPHGFYLAMDSAAGLDPLHEAGAYYIQEPSAMAPVALLAPRPGERVLDLCAAPGGKTTQIADALGGEGLIVCNEPVPSRAKILSRNVERMGVANALVVSAEPERLAPLWPQAFDAILVDAPCSGEGMFRRHPETREEWNESSPAGCAVRQKRILACAAQMLRPGGRLAYSTCTLNREENEEVIAWLLSEHPELQPVPFSLPIGNGQTLDAPQGMAHLYPHRLRGEGHFVALLHRQGDAPASPFLAAAKCLGAPQKPLLAAYEAFTRPFPGLPRANAQLGDTLLSSPGLPPLQGVRVLRAGIQLGTLKGKVFAPDHALAMALPADPPIPTLPVTREAALRYQSGETLPCPETLSGYVLPTLAGLPLGFGKASNGQLKNHYPKGLRR
ncbi:MAG: RsmB/NOP family class I SAM-dependent RNA methyltransferase [Clostridia bacterium]|nr:RsmB/NOP family class I SAM-dependent RNA methyltransferase [Clostridia bacterium]